MKKGLESEFRKRIGKQQEHLIKQNTGDREEMTKTKRHQERKFGKSTLVENSDFFICVHFAIHATIFPERVRP